MKARLALAHPRPRSHLFSRGARAARAGAAAGGLPRAAPEPADAAHGRALASCAGGGASRWLAGGVTPSPSPSPSPAATFKDYFSQFGVVEEALIMRDGACLARARIVLSLEL